MGSDDIALFKVNFMLNLNFGDKNRQVIEFLLKKPLRNEITNKVKKSVETAPASSGEGPRFLPR